MIANDMDPEIVNDFLTEAGELLEQLDTNLLELENDPENMETINTIFRCFHTVKGGAGFLSLDELGTLCHKAEDCVGLVRSGKLAITSKLIDSLLEVQGVAIEMCNRLRTEGLTGDAPQNLLATLAGFINEEKPEGKDNKTDAVEMVFEEILDNALENQQQDDELITEDEFDALLDQLNGTTSPGTEEISETDDSEIDEDEFDALLDQLHGAGNSPTSQPKTAEKITADIAIPEPVKPVNNKTSLAPAETTTRVDTALLDDIMNMVGELVLARNSLSILKTKLIDEKIINTVTDIDHITTSLQNVAMQTRMLPIKKVFGKFPRIVRDLARKLGKKINLELKGEDTGLDKNMVEILSEPLTHLIRNCADHGIESIEQRLAVGKPAEGKIILAAEQIGDHILITINDDGAGMDPEKLRKIAVEKNIITSEAAAGLNDQESFALIFAPGFSGKATVTDVSGRGVGMDVVKTKIGEINGSVEIDSERNKGTTISIKLPLTLAIMSTLMVRIMDQILAIPAANIQEIIVFDPLQMKKVDENKVIIFREKTLPLYFLRTLLNNHGGELFAPQKNRVIIIEHQNRQRGVVVDQVIGQEEIMIKPLGALTEDMKFYSGTTITGEGRIALILDMPELLDQD